MRDFQLIIFIILHFNLKCTIISTHLPNYVCPLYTDVGICWFISVPFILAVGFSLGCWCVILNEIGIIRKVPPGLPHTLPGHDTASQTLILLVRAQTSGVKL